MAMATMLIMMGMRDGKAVVVTYLFDQEMLVLLTCGEARRGEERRESAEATVVNGCTVRWMGCGEDGRVRECVLLTLFEQVAVVLLLVV